MREASRGSSSRSWFRVENAHVDDNQSDNDITKIYIYDEIGESWFGDSTGSNDFVKMLSGITTPNIELHLNSPGGDIFDGVAIYNALKSHPAKVKVVVDALAASAASFIAQAGDEVIMTGAATMMIHDGSGFSFGNAADMRKTADILDTLSNTIAGIYASRAGQSTEFWRNLMVEETWYNASEAVEAGLADRVGEETKKEDEEAAQNKWDLSFFNYAGRGAAPDPLVVRQRIANRLKEITVPQNSDQSQTKGPGSDVNPASPQVDPDAQTTEGTASKVQDERESSGNPGAVPNPPTPDGVQNRAVDSPVTFTVGDKSYTMSAKEAGQKLAELMEFQNVTMTTARKNFVEQLAVDNKISAPQIEKLTNYALTLSDEQYSAWKATYDDAPSLPMLGGTFASGTTNHDGPQSQEVEAANKELDTLKGVVNRLGLSGLTNEQIMQTSSYKKLVALDPTFKL